MKVTNVVLANVGGVGTSHIAWWLAQYFRASRKNTYCVDTCPFGTFSQHAALQVEHIEIYDPDSVSGCFNLGKFDAWVERGLRHDGPCVIDVGAASFLQFLCYMNEADIFGLFKKHGHRVIVHVPLVGGGRVNSTVSCLKSILERTGAEFVVWENEFFGPVEVGARLYSDPALPVEVSDRFLGSVKIMRRNASTFGRDILNVMLARLTVEEALSREEFGIMPKRRLSIMRQRLFEQLEAIPALSTSKRPAASLGDYESLRLAHDHSFARLKKR